MVENTLWQKIKQKQNLIIKKLAHQPYTHRLEFCRSAAFNKNEKKQSLLSQR